MKAEGCGGFVHATCSRVAALPRSLAFPAVLTGLVACLVASSSAADATVTAALPAGVTARGLDVSAFQHAHGAVIDWSRLAQQGIGFVGIKVSEGTYYANPYYASDARDARAAGITVLPYVFANPKDSGGAATAAYAISALSYQRNGKTLPLAVDLENDPYTKKGHPGNCYGLGAPQMVAWITAFTSETARLTGVHPVIYTTADWWRQCTRNTALFRQNPLWVAAYGVPTPSVPLPWQQWTFWQYTDAGVLPGVGMTDLDYLNPGKALSIKHAPVPKHRPAKHKPAKHPSAKHKPAKKRSSKHRSSKPRPSKNTSKKTSRKRGRRAAAHPAAKPRTSYRIG